MKFDWIFEFIVKEIYKNIIYTKIQISTPLVFSVSKNIHICHLLVYMSNLSKIEYEFEYR